MIQACLVMLATVGQSSSAGTNSNLKEDSDTDCQIRRIDLQTDGGVAEAAAAVVGDEPVLLYNLPPQKDSLMQRLSLATLANSDVGVWVGTGADFHAGRNAEATRRKMTIVRPSSLQCTPSLNRKLALDGAYHFEICQHLITDLLASCPLTHTQSLDRHLVFHRTMNTLS